MNLDDLKERFYTEGQSLIDRVQESGPYNSFMDVYYNWPSAAQKAFKVGSLLLVAFLFLSYPLGELSTAGEQIEAYDDIRSTTQELINVSKDLAAAPSLPIPPNFSYLKEQITSALTRAELKPEQIKDISATEITISGIKADWIDSKLQVQLENLNLQQILDIGTDIQSIQSNVKIADLVIEAGKMPLYHNVVFKVFTLAGKKIETPEEEPEEPKSRRSRKKSVE